MNYDQSRKYIAKQEAKARDAREIWEGLKILLTILIVLLTFVSCTLYISHDSEQDMAAKAVVVSQRWNKWQQFKEQSCSLAEHSFGVTSRAGKGTVTDNIDTYNCNGVLYSVSSTMQQQVSTCVSSHDCYNLRLDSIPAPD